jgi:hypothetical protein
VKTSNLTPFVYVFPLMLQTKNSTHTAIGDIDFRLIDVSSF